MGYVSVAGLRLHVEEQGAGPHLVIAHGLFGSVAGAERGGVIAGDLAARGFHVVQYDARGHGRSDAASSASDYSWSSLAGELLGVMDALHLTRASVLGSSMGAGAALLASLQAPDRFERLVLRTPPAFGVDTRGVRRRMGALATLYRWLGPALTRGLLSAVGQSATAELLGEQQPGVVPTAIAGLLFGPSELPEARFGELVCPSLILTHPRDPEHPLRSGDVLSRMPHATLRVAKTRGYWRAHPAELTRLVTAFLRGEPI
jgi:3-oxoadipate enol-lactonase